LLVALYTIQRPRSTSQAILYLVYHQYGPSPGPPKSSSSSSSKLTWMCGAFFFFQLLTAITEAIVAADTMGEAKSSIFCNISSDIRLGHLVHYLELVELPTFL